MPYKITSNCKLCNKQLSHPKSSLCRNCWLSQDHSGEKSPSYKNGRPLCQQCGQTLSSYSHKTQLCRQCHDQIAGKDHWNWRGGLSKRILNDEKYKTWRCSVFERDDFTCQHCHRQGGKIHAHHIIRWVDDVSKRYDTNNGITLCIICHKLIHNWKVSQDELLSVFPSSWGT